MIIEAPDSHVSMNHLVVTLERRVPSCSKLERRKYLLCIWKGAHLGCTGPRLFFQRCVSSNSDQSLQSNFTWVLR